MFSHREYQQVFKTMILLLLVAGCAQAEPITRAATVPPPQPPPPEQQQPPPAADQEGIFKFVKTIQVTPDENFSDGGLGHIHYVPATDRMVVMLSVQLEKPVTLTYSAETCQGKALAYKEYTTDMQPTGKFGYLYCASADINSRIIGNDIYLASMTTGHVSEDGQPEWTGWHVEKFDAVSWNRLAYVDIPLDISEEIDDGPTIADINGQIVVSGEYFPDGNPDGPLGRGSHHHFFTTNLEPLGKKILMAPETPSHCPMISMIQEPGGDILMFAATAYFDGSLLMLRFDKEWNFIEQKELREQAFFPTGSVSDENLFYIAYTDISKKGPMPLYRNVGLAAYDRNWQLLQDVAVTDFVNTDDTWIDGESPWVQLLGKRLFVSYLESELDPVGGLLVENQAYVNIYELTRMP
jgi:hypothetical protein